MTHLLQRIYTGVMILYEYKCTKSVRDEANLSSFILCLVPLLPPKLCFLIRFVTIVNNPKLAVAARIFCCFSLTRHCRGVLEANNSNCVLSVEDQYHLPTGGSVECPMPSKYVSSPSHYSCSVNILLCACLFIHRALCDTHLFCCQKTFIAWLFNDPRMGRSQLPQVFHSVSLSSCNDIKMPCSVNTNWIDRFWIADLWPRFSLRWRRLWAPWARYPPGQTSSSD